MKKGDQIRMSILTFFPPRTQYVDGVRAGIIIVAVTIALSVAFSIPVAVTNRYLFQDPFG